MLRQLPRLRSVSSPVYTSTFSTQATMPETKTLLYLFRRDLRVSDNPILNTLTQEGHGYTHLLPVYVFPAQQLEVGGFIPLDSDEKSPYPEARSQVAGFWRCGPHRAQFMAESVWDLKSGLENVGSGLCIRVGMVGEVVTQLLEAKDLNIKGVWLTGEEGTEEKQEERDIKNACDGKADYKIWIDEKYLIDDTKLPFEDPKELPDVFTTYRKIVEPLRAQPLPVLPTPAKASLPTFPSSIPTQYSPFVIPSNLEGLVEAVLRPLAAAPLAKDPPLFPSGAKTAHPFKGGESHAHARLAHLLSSGALSTYHSTRNGLLGLDFSSKLSAYLSQGCITARQVHASMLALEDGTNSDWSSVAGYGEGESEGMKSMRFELLWRDYMRLCNRKFGPKLFPITGFKGTTGSWISPNNPGQGKTKEEVADMIERFLNGTTGMGLIDASQRELFHTGYTSNRARQNVASFLAKHLYIDWRIGAEWYESMLIDYDLSSNWGNWQYVAGVGNDPRESRSFNPVKQAFDYDPQAEYVKTWIEELRGIENPAGVFQAWTLNQESREKMSLSGIKWVENPLKRIEFTVGRKAPGQMRNRGRGGGQAGEGGNRGRWHTFAGRGRGQGRGGYGGRGYGSSRGHLRGRGDGPGGGGREARTGMTDKVHDQHIEGESANAMQ